MKRILILAVWLLLIAGGCRPDASANLDRHPRRIEYSHHARCRMECRNIDEQEIRTVIADGFVNMRKSRMNADDCHKRYAVEGTAHNDRLRIVVAQCGGVTTVITCIDLDHDWPCDCPGDEKR
jgi:hypothetical protein